MHGQGCQLDWILKDNSEFPFFNIDEQTNLIHFRLQIFWPQKNW